MLSSDGIQPVVQGSNLNEDLGQINCIFSDKTGTLTCNIMNFKCIWINPETQFGQFKKQQQQHQNYYLQNNPIQNVSFYDENYEKYIKKIQNNNNNNDQLEQSLLCLAICHTLLIDQETREYQASSPDELALANFAKFSGYVYKGKDTKNVITVKNKNTQNNEKLQFQVQYILEFNSDRKRMSIIVKDKQSNKIMLYSKGADNVMLARLNKNTEKKNEINKILSEYSSQGLRTLVLAKKELDIKEYKEFSRKIDLASQSFGDRERQMAIVMDSVEQNLDFLAVTAIEDKLQDEVQETIQTLKQANIGFWILTGDKQETAINIGYSTGVLEKDDNIVELDYEKFQELDIEQFGDQADFTNHALVIQGSAFESIFAEKEQNQRKFGQIISLCKQVIACRVSPKQKKEIVALYKEWYPDQRVLSIGDGANDVNMINEAHVGIGIKGQEGVQAARASDFAIGEFKLLRPLLLYYGREYYRKNSILINYNFYKNVLYLFPNFWFGIFSGYIGSNLYDVLLFQGFNAMYCAIPIMLYAVFDKEFPQSFLVSNPLFYVQGLTNKMFNNILFWKWFAQGAIQALIITIIMLFGTDMYGNQAHGDYQIIQGQMIFFMVIVTVNVKVLLITHYFFGLVLAINFLSTLSYSICLAIVSQIKSNELFNTFSRVYGNDNFGLTALLVFVSVSFIDLGIMLYNNFIYYGEVNKMVTEKKNNSRAQIRQTSMASLQKSDLNQVENLREPLISQQNEENPKEINLK